jgi:general secretion pathway protein D
MQTRGSTQVYKTLIRQWLAVYLALTLTPPAPVFARNKKGDKLLKEGAQAEAAMDWDKALELYELAVQEDPSDRQYQMTAQRVRFQAGQKHIKAGRTLRTEGKLEEAAEEFRRAFAIDPSSGLAQSELRRTLRMIEDSKGKAEAKGEERGRTPGEQAAAAAEQRANSIEPAPVLKPMSRQISTLKMNNQPVKVLFETLGKLAGINVIFDSEYQSPGRNYSIDLVNTTLEEGLDSLSVLTKTYWKPLSPTTIFVTNDNVTKRRDYEDMVVKAFYIRNITTPQELQEIATVIRSVTDIRRVFTYNALGAIILRGTVDQVALAEKLVGDLDKPKSEVVVDVFVMEVARARTRDLAMSLISGGQQGLRVPVTFTPRAILGSPTASNGSDGSDGNGGTDTGDTTTTEGSIRVSNLDKLSGKDYTITLPSFLFQALMSDRGTRVMHSPQLRATDSVKSSLKIGDRYPYATGSFQPGVGTVGVSPLVSTQFQFADVGVNVDLTPKIHSEDEVSLQVEMDLSNIRDQIDVGGLSQPVIGQRKITHNVRLRQGEVSILGGLISDQDIKAVSGVPGLGNIGIVKRFFTGERIERNQAELVIALVPHIIRSTDVTNLNLRGVAAGTDQVVKLRYQPLPDDKLPGESATPEAEKSPGRMKPEAGAPPVRTESPAAPPKPAIPADLPKPDVPKPADAPPAPTPDTAAPKPAGARLRFIPDKMEVPMGANLTLILNAEQVTDLFGAPLRVQWDPKVLRLSDVSRGAMLAGDGQQPIFSRNIMNERGEAAIILNRLPGTTGISGAGSLLSLVFQAVGTGKSEVKLADVTLRDSKMQTIGVDAGATVITVQ